MTTVRELMSENPECVNEEDNLVTVAARMRDVSVGALPICDADQHPVGILTDRDIVVRCVADGLKPDQKHAGDVAERDPVCVRAGAPIDEAMTLMAEHKVRRLPVVDTEQHLVGMISQADIAREQPESQTGSVVEDISR